MTSIATSALTRPVLQVGEGRAFGTFGELLQGVLLDSGRPRDFLVTLPITHGSVAHFAADADLVDVHTMPAHKVKSQQLARMLLEHFGLPPGGRLELQSRLPEGKGLASSSADLVATARAVAAHFSLALSTELLQCLMRRVEPSDGVMYDEVTAFYHREVRLLRGLGPVPPLTIVAVDEGGQVDTLMFNARASGVNVAEATEYAHLLESIRRALTAGDLHAVGRIATRSAALNQQRLPKQWLKPVRKVCDEVNGLGVVVAHSGTCLGVLLATESPLFREQLELAQTRLRALTGHALVYQSGSC